MNNIKNLFNQRLILVALLLFSGFFLALNQAQAAATSVTIQSPNFLVPAYAKPNTTIPVLYYVTADPPGFSGFYNMYLSQSAMGYSFQEFNRTFMSGSNGYSDNYNVGNVADGIYDLAVNVPDAGDLNTSSVVVDGTPPTTPTVTYPSAAGIYLRPSNTVLITWTASSDTNFGPTPISVVYSLSGTFLDGVTIATLPATATSTTWRPPNVSSATVKVAVIATDLAGNMVSDSSNNAFALDNQAPTVDAGTLGIISTPTRPGASASDNISASIALTYAWSLLSGPSGGTLIASNASILNPYLSGTVTGSYTARLTVTDQAGNSAFDSVTFSWNGNPGMFSVTTPDSGDYLAGGEATSITWTTPSGGDLNHFKLEYSINEGNSWVLINNSVASTSNTYTWTPPNVNTVSNFIRVTAYDNDTNSTAAISGGFTIDSTAPAGLTLTYPSATPLYLKGGSDYNIDWTTPTDINLKPLPIDLTYCIDQECILLTSNLPAEGPYVWRVPSLNTSSAKVSITATDLADNIAYDESDNPFIIDSLAPVITITNPNLGSIKTPTVSGASAVDNLSGVASYAWSQISGPGAITFSPSAGMANPTLAGSISGAYVARLTVTDNAGNVATSDVSFTWDGTPGNFSVTAPTVGSYLKGGSPSNITWTNPGDSDLNHYKIEYSSNNGSSWSLVQDNIASTTLTYSWSVPLNNTAQNYIRVTAYDNDSNYRTVNSGLFIVDSTAPAAAVINPSAAGIKLKGGASYNITWSASDTYLNSSNIVLDYSNNNGSSWSNITTTSNSGSYTWTVSGPETTTGLVRVTATDLAGNSTSDISNNNFVVDNNGPVITITNPNLGAINAPTATGASAVDSYSGIASYAWSKISGPGTISFLPSSSAANPTLSANVNGSYSARLTVTDNVGNISTRDVTFTWDTTAPTITITPLTPDPTSDATPTFTGTATDA
ncbi:MAG: Ig-like domain repeat protein, partial [Patescibacteria group bacterium]|nr:Ig-like domain repeat protein [Patescibacteria group bacterium]